jgi:hypothetical protein
VTSPVFINVFLKAPPSTYNTDASQRTTKKKGLSVDPKNKVSAVEKGAKKPTVDDSTILDTGAHALAPNNRRRSSSLR